MDSRDFVPLVEQLDDNIDDLEEAASLLLRNALSETAGKLPLLDKAKLYVTVAYAIESIIFSLLRLTGTNAKEHPIFRELTRIKQYFEKITTAETDNSERNTSLDKAAAGRFIKHALAGNDSFDAKEGQQLAGEKSRPQAKFDQISSKRKRSDEEMQGTDPNAQLTEAVSSQSSSSSVQSSSPGTQQPEHAIPDVANVVPKAEHGDGPQTRSSERPPNPARKRKRQKKSV